MTYTFDQRFLDLPRVDAANMLAMSREQQCLRDHLITSIWPEHDHAAITTKLSELLAEAQKRLPSDRDSDDTGWSERQMVLICYGDHIRSKDPNVRPLQALGEFCRHHFSDQAFSDLILHLLPIYASPYKDGGFDIADPFAVNPQMGTWEDVQALQQHFHVAVDFVANHLSIASEWFTRYMQDDPLFHDFFIGVDDPQQVAHFEQNILPKIYRPRPHNPLIPVQKRDGTTRWVYMTFSDHQADVNYANPFVFLKMLETLLFYVIQGASIVRLDAIPYLWKEWGTSCAHHPRTHALVELFRLATDVVSPSVKLLAESMEPLADSQRYLSTEQAQKAHLAYNFLPCGLIPHTLVTGDATIFQEHLRDFLPPHRGVNWAVVCGVTHDGSSMNPCRAPKSVPGEAVLTEAHIAAVADYYTAHGMQELEQRMTRDVNAPDTLPQDYLETFTQKHGESPRFVNYKTIVDDEGNTQKIVYEAISTYGSLFDQQPEKIIAALSMALALPGIPFTYLTLPFARLNDFTYYLQTGNPRELNRGRVVLEELLTDLANQDTLSAKVFSAYTHLLRLRVSCPAFHPDGDIIPLDVDHPAILAFVRVSVDQQQQILVVQNVSNERHSMTLSLNEHLPARAAECRDLLSGDHLLLDTQQQLHLDLSPFAVLWAELRT